MATASRTWTSGDLTGLPRGQRAAGDADRRPPAGPLRRARARRRQGGRASGKARRGRRLDQRRLLRPVARRCSTTSPAMTRVWEQEPLERLAREGQLAAYRHDGFWQPMDTLRDKRQLEELWRAGQARRGRRGDRCSRVLARPTRPRHRAHGLQGRLAQPLARPAGARVTGFALPSADLAQPLHDGGHRAADRLAAR